MCAWFKCTLKIAIKFVYLIPYSEIVWIIAKKVSLVLINKHGKRYRR